MDRRLFLTGVVAAVGATAVPLPIGALATEPAIPVKLLAFAAGSDGEFNWQPFFAATEAEATAMARSHFGWDAELDGDDFPYELKRVPRWDKRGYEGDVTPADWFRAGMGHCCDRCGDECFSGDGEGSMIVGELVVCGECATVIERIAADPDDFEDALAERIADDGEEDARKWLESQHAWADAAAIWPKALARAAA